MPYNNYPITDLNTFNFDYVLDQTKQAVTRSISAKETADGVRHDLDNLNVEDEVREVIEEMAEDGTLSQIIGASLHRDIIIISDSYGKGTQPGAPDIRGFAERVKNNVESTTNRKVYTNCHDSSGFTQGYHFQTQLQDVASPLSQYDKDAVTLILVVGGANDCHGTHDDIVAYMEAFSRYAHTTFKNADIKVMMVGNVVDGLTTASFTSANMKATRLAYEDGCRNSNMAYVPRAWWLMGYNAHFASDYLHPNDLGAGKLFKGVMAVINGEDFTFEGTGENVWNTSESGVATSYLYFSLDNKKCTWYANLTKYLTANTTTKLVNIKHAFLQYFVARESVTIMGQNSSADASTILMPGYAILQNHDISLYQLRAGYANNAVLRAEWTVC